MKTLKTAPQILEHYSEHCDTDDYILKAMRHYNRTKIENLKDKLREEVKDEMYEEARKNLESQYEVVTEVPLYTLTRKGPNYYRASSKLVGMLDFAMFDGKTPQEAMGKLTEYLKSKNIIK